ncbi:DEAD/DEAH box helicase [Halarchaeum grantii]|uniref:DEAD/DEAH box helicase n=1 Tax=Halarchaeum grantii TaxID=1193105 RepID=A0A830F481_9EURY|nr:DEAD/DEAH box helicase [Halarchaeum grantii]GGL37140.1 DEAD/DEAH box helicase [Halarchaeum grantii]
MSETPQRETPLTGHDLESTYPDYDGQIAAVATQEAREAETVPASEAVDPALAARLDVDPYTHQAAALDALDRGENVTVATSTSSGKTLVYALEIARNYLADESTRALLVYPTKALARDQERALNDLYDDLGLDVRVEVYDGDTPSEVRKEYREEANVVLTNFSGVNVYLEDHARWREFHGNCELLVVDESHTYVGVHGMHVAWTIRRLRRVLAHYGSDPQIVCTTATVGNPAEHAAALTGEPTTVIDDDGSPRGRRDIVFWNPPRETAGLDADAGYEAYVEAAASAGEEAADLLAHLGLNGVQTLAFTRSRQGAEVGAKRAGRAASDHPESGYLDVEPYHAGLGTETRRGIEYRLKSGQLDGVVSTNALELGIDVGSVDAALLTGYPGTRQSFWQQLGRAGRGASDALGVLVARSDAIDQYVVDTPDYLLSDPVEDAVVDLANDPVYARHLRCAASELPLTHADERWFGGAAVEGAADDRMARAVEMWRRAGDLVGDLDRGVRYDGAPRPQSGISMYNSSEVSFDVRCANGEIDHEPVDRERAYREYHEGALFLHDGRTYEVTAFEEDTASPHVTVAEVAVEEYTETRSTTRIHDLEERERRRLGEYALCWGEGVVDVHHAEYARREVQSGDLVEPPQPTGLGPLSLQTQLCWLELPDGAATRLVGDWLESDDDADAREFAPGDAEREYMGGIHAAEHALITLAPLELKLSADDLGGLSVREHPETGGATLFVYDGVAGGVGFSKALFEQLDAVGTRARERIAACDCGVGGCPCCVMDANCGDENDPLNTAVARRLLEDVLAEL